MADQLRQHNNKFSQHKPKMASQSRNGCVSSIELCLFIFLSTQQQKFLFFSLFVQFNHMLFASSKTQCCSSPCTDFLLPLAAQQARQATSRAKIDRRREMKIFFPFHFSPLFSLSAQLAFLCTNDNSVSFSFSLLLLLLLLSLLVPRLIAAIHHSREHLRHKQNKLTWRLPLERKKQPTNKLVSRVRAIRASCPNTCALDPHLLDYVRLPKKTRHDFASARQASY